MELWGTRTLLPFKHLPAYKQGHKVSIVYPLHLESARLVFLVQMLLYLTKLDSKPSLGVKDCGSVMYNLRESVLGRAIVVPCLPHDIHRQPVTVASNGTAFGSGDQQMNYSEEGENRLFLFLNVTVHTR